MTISEDYVTFETAKLLKEKGFDIETKYFYNEGSGWKFQSDSILKTGEGEWVNAPTQALALKWLRIKHNIHIWIAAVSGNKWYWKAQLLNAIGNDEEKVKSYSNFADTPEEAIEAAVVYTLKNLIK